ncbi:hypothetical protein FVEG_13155 [Fusarium verticillioides 7600]|uniref:Glycosyl hydrolases family 39 N-terminal catalytic domain-containing protein n=1 Tax=Gibberella moniliformis (strain M3125 / FGSC 7600) TaxID=334819 RepID=W7MV91_GIBM7|nr:hypothetical protein FVEG_13155 [Fusarium verticillioides 7600]EWG55106.1 hypothetical protein FVEG_13155 [Fusarium verticillioides 7600]
MPEEYMSMLKSLPSEVDKVKEAVVGVATVDVSIQIGPPRHLASGILYGIPDRPNQIPDHFYKDIGFNYGRGGGSQLPGTKGYAVCLEDYEARFASALSNYRTTRKHGGEFIYLLPAAWGADGGQSDGFVYPGDDNDWTSWDAFLERTLDDVKKSDMIDGLVVDIWNEPDLTFFWNRSMEQWLELWTRSFKKIREVLPSVRITGPSISAIPSASHEWWSAFLSRCKDTLPDQWSWHMEGGEETVTMASSMASFHDLLSKHGIPLEKAKDVNINEYAVYGEQVPSAGAWWIAGLERENAHGLRGNWAIAGALHDFMAGLLSKPNSSDGSYAIEGEGYWPTAEFQVYKYYASSMNGQRLKTSASSDGLLDVYATVEADVVRILAGTRSRPGNWSVDVIGLTDDTRVTVKTLAFRVVDGDKFRRVDGPHDLGEREEVVKEGRVRLRMKHQDPTTAFAFEVLIAEGR